MEPIKQRQQRAHLQLSELLQWRRSLKSGHFLSPILCAGERLFQSDWWRVCVKQCNKEPLAVIAHARRSLPTRSRPQPAQVERALRPSQARLSRASASDPSLRHRSTSLAPSALPTRKIRLWIYVGQSRDSAALFAPKCANINLMESKRPANNKKRKVQLKSACSLIDFLPVRPCKRRRATEEAEDEEAFE